jgi:type II secretory pathway component PulC
VSAASPRVRRSVAVAWLVVLGTAATVHAQSALPQPPSSTPASAPGVQSPAPPFWVAGVVLTAARRSASVVVLDDARRDVGLVTVREGENYGGYRLASVQSDRVLFERDGTVIAVPVGRPSESRAAPSPARPSFFFIPGPDTPTLDVPRDQARREAAPSDAAAPPNRLDPEALKMLLERLSDAPR